MLIAVSETSDPTGNWYSWSFDVDDTPDYMKFGIWDDGYYMATNTRGKNDVYVFERDVMIAGGASPTMIAFSNPNRPSTFDNFHCIMPLDNDGPSAPSGANGGFITVADDDEGNPGDELWIYECVPDWGTPVNSTFTRTQVLSVNPFVLDFNGSWSNIPQPGTTQKLDAVSTVLMFRAQYRNFSGTEKIVCAHTIAETSDEGAIRWYILERTGGTWSIDQQSTYNPGGSNGTSYWLPSIAMNGAGQVAMGYNVSSSTNNIYPEIRVVGRSECAPDNTMDMTESVVATSSSSQTGANRWGDYAGMGIDPDDDYTFWFTTEYTNNGGNTKSTRIVAFTLDASCNTPTVTDVSPTSLYEDKGKQLTITGSDLIGCTFDIGGVSGTVSSNDGNTAVVLFSAGNYTNGTLTVTNGAGSDNSHSVTVNTRNTIPVVAGSSATSDNHPTILSAVNGLHAWYGTTAFNAGDLAGTKTIEVHAGTYTDEVTLNSELNPTVANPLIIQNNSGDVVTINASGNNYGFNLSTVDYVQLKGFTIHDATENNVYLQGNNCEISYIKAYNGGNSGIKVETGTSNGIVNNLLYANSKYGIHISNSNNNTVKNNTLDDNGSNVTGGTVYLLDDDFDPTPSGWSRYTKSSTSGGWAYNNGDGVGSSYCMEVADPDVYQGWVTTTNALAIPAGVTSIDIQYEHRADYSTSYNTVWRLEKSTAPGNTDADWTTIDSWTTSASHPTSYTTISRSTAVTPGSNVNIGWYCENNNQDGLRIDNIKISYTAPSYTIGAGLYVESGTGTTVENNIFVAKSGNNAYYTLKSENGITVSSDYNTYYTTNTNLFDYNGTQNNSGPMSANDLNGDPLFVGSGDYHIFSTNDSYHGGEWPPTTASSGGWTTDGSDSPALDAGNPADSYTNEPASGGRINQGAYGNTVQASKTVSTVTISWTGAVSTNWQTAGNWDSGTIPTSGEDVTIPGSLTNYPVINNGISTIALCNNLTIDAGASVTINPDGYMTVSGSITNSAGTSGLIINSDANCYLNSGASRLWHFVSSPVTSAPVSVFTSTSNLYYYDESTDDYWSGTTYGSGSVSGWTPFTSGNMSVNKGYANNYFTETLNFTGQLNNNNATNSISVPYTDYEGSGNGEPGYNYPDMDGWNLIGNPYTSAIDWNNAAVAHAAAHLTDAIYVWDAAAGTYKSYVNGAGTNDATQYIPAMQGFYVKGDATKTSGTLNIGADARVHNNQDYWKSAYTTPENFIRIQIKASNNYTDETVIRILNEATFNMDNGTDAYKLFTWNKDVPQIYTNTINNTEYSVNSIPLFEEKSFSIPLKAIQTGEKYSLNITEFNFPISRTCMFIYKII